MSDLLHNGPTSQRRKRSTSLVNLGHDLRLTPCADWLAKHGGLYFRLYYNRLDSTVVDEQTH
jgi:hypothetical protein